MKYNKICIYCGLELGVNQEYFHRCSSMNAAGATTPLAQVDIKFVDQPVLIDHSIAEDNTFIQGKREGFELAIKLIRNQYETFKHLVSYSIVADVIELEGKHLGVIESVRINGHFTENRELIITNEIIRKPEQQS